MTWRWDNWKLSTLILLPFHCNEREKCMNFHLKKNGVTIVILPVKTCSSLEGSSYVIVNYKIYRNANILDDTTTFPHFQIININFHLWELAKWTNTGELFEGGIWWVVQKLHRRSSKLCLTWTSSYRLSNFQSTLVVRYWIFPQNR